MNQIKLKEADLFGVAEIAVRYKSTVPTSKRAKVSEPRDAVNVLKYAYSRDEIDLDYVEAFYVIYMNRANKVLAVEQIGKGGISGTYADPKVVFQRALLVNASCLILAHNHPSQNLSPSKTDFELTEKMVQCGKFLDCKVLDHFIITSEGYCSLSEDGTVEFQ